MHSFAAHMKNRLPETLLLLVAAVALFWTVLYGFHTTDEARQSIAMIVLWPAVLLIALTAASYSPRTVVGGGVGIVLVCVVGMCVFAGAAGQNPLADSYDNPAFPYLLGFFVTVLSYLCTRKKALCILFVVGGAFTCVIVQFLYLNSLWVQVIAFIIGAVGFLICASHKHFIPKPAKGDVSFVGAALVALLLGVVAVAAACAVWFAAIAPLNPPAVEIKLFTEEYALEEVHVYGFKNVEHKNSDDLKSNKTEESDKTSKNESDVTDEKQQDSDQDGNLNKNKESGANNGTDDDSNGTAGSLVRYLLDLPLWLLIPLGVAVIVALLVALRMLLRRLSMRRLEALPPQRQLIGYQSFFDKRLRMLGYARTAALTPIEYAREHASDYAAFEDGVQDQASFAAMTASACAVTYGEQTPSASDLQCCKELHRVFYTNVRKRVGNIKYFFLYFFRM